MRERHKAEWECLDDNIIEAVTRAGQGMIEHNSPVLAALQRELGHTLHVARCIRLATKSICEAIDDHRRATIVGINRGDQSDG